MIQVKIEAHSATELSLLGEFMTKLANARVDAPAPIIVAAPDPSVAEEVPAKPGKRQKKVADTAPAVEPSVPADSAAPTESAPSKPVTLEEVRAKLAAMSQAGQRDQVMELLGRFGATKLTDVDPARFSELMLAAEVM